MTTTRTEQSAQSARSAPQGEPAPPQLADFHTSAGPTLLERTKQQDVLLVFLRHFGCTFCREAVAEVAKSKDDIEHVGAAPIFVHMTPDPVRADEFFRRWGSPGAEHVADPDRVLYRAFGLERGSAVALFGPKVWLRGAQAFLKGYGVGGLQGDGFQMPGVFLLRDARIVAAHRHATAGDQPDYALLAACPVNA
jgi:hypothetical protein